MRRRAGFFSQAGLLLVEAILAAVVIAVSLAVISRALGGQLTALQSTQEYDTLLALAHRKLVELESEALASHQALSPEMSGTFSAPSTNYRWAISAATPLGDPVSGYTSEITIAVERTDRTSPKVQMTEVWPLEWVRQEWLAAHE